MMVASSRITINDQLQEELDQVIKIFHEAKWSAFSALLTTLIGVLSLLGALFTFLKWAVAFALFILLFARVKLAQAHAWVTAQEQNYQSSLHRQEERDPFAPSAARPTDASGSGQDFEEDEIEAEGEETEKPPPGHRLFHFRSSRRRQQPQQKGAQNGPAADR
ncbi:MAG: hypothetical protein J2P36_27395 [Ktedonobacteraceae bacterium]|nr:hypothetical protein [Ktedonobacteraceae bacterium]